MTSSLWNWLFYAWIQRDKVKWVLVTLIKGHLRAANSRNNKLYWCLIKKFNISALNEKNRFLFGCFLTFFLRLQIYEAIAAIFWQFASSVYFSFSTFEIVFLFNWLCSIDLLIRYSTSKILFQFIGLYFRTYPAVFVYFVDQKFVSLLHFAAFSTSCVKSFWLL